MDCIRSNGYRAGEEADYDIKDAKQKIDSNKEIAGIDDSATTRVSGVLMILWHILKLILTYFGIMVGIERS